jgi:L-alanine-DL-glutamate epimerase-like enolase superfamily enzyme
MKIAAITVYQVDLPFVDGSYVMAKGKTVSIADSTVVRLDTDEGLTGWGEACPLGPFYLPSYPEGLRAGIGALARHVIGLDPTRIGEVNRVMDREMLGHPYVKSALDVACWDILGKAAGLPLHALLGGRQNGAMPMYRSVSQGNPEDANAVAGRYRAEGYRQIQLKVGGDPVADAETIRLVVESAPPGDIVLADANTGWRRAEALYVAKATRDLHYYLEQPCERYDDCLAVRRRAEQPFKLDESLQSLEDLLRARADDACDVACIKISKHGGLTKARLIRDACAALGMPMTVEDVWGGDIVTAALAHLAASTPAAALLNTTDLHNYNSVHVADGAPVAQGGRLTVGDAPGLGITPREDALGEPVAAYH